MWEELGSNLRDTMGAPRTTVYAQPDWRGKKKESIQTFGAEVNS